MSKVIFVVLFFLLFTACGPGSGGPTSTSGVYRTPNPTATPTLTVTATHTATDTATPCPTPPIIEVTPRGGFMPTPASGYVITSLTGRYMPFARQYVRACPVVSEACQVKYTLSGITSVDVYAQLVVYPQGDIWLCLDAPPALYVDSYCVMVVAFRIGAREYGNFVLD